MSLSLSTLAPPAALVRIVRSPVPRRLLAVPVVAFVVMTLVFVVAHLLPGDPVTQMTATDSQITPQQVAELRAQLGLSSPLPVQYVDYLRGIFTGNWGNSLYDGQSVLSLIGAALPVTVELAVDRKSTRLNSSHLTASRMPSSA